MSMNKKCFLQIVPKYKEIFFKKNYNKKVKNFL